jgi:hypothetical protein
MTMLVQNSIGLLFGYLMSRSIVGFQALFNHRGRFFVGALPKTLRVVE